MVAICVTYYFAMGVLYVLADHKYKIHITFESCYKPKNRLLGPLSYLTNFVFTNLRQMLPNNFKSDADSCVEQNSLKAWLVRNVLLLTFLYLENEPKSFPLLHIAFFRLY